MTIKPGDPVLYAGPRDMWPATVLQTSPMFSEALIRDDVSGYTRWMDFEDLTPAKDHQ
jgi:hypothetical protein